MFSVKEIVKFQWRSCEFTFMKVSVLGLRIDVAVDETSAWLSMRWVCDIEYFVFRCRYTRG